MTKADQVLKYFKGKDLDHIFWEIWDTEIEYVNTYEEDLDQRRWYMIVHTIFEFDDGSYVAVRWGKGLTENQDNTGVMDLYLVEPYVVQQTKFKRIK